MIENVVDVWNNKEYMNEDIGAYATSSRNRCYNDYRRFASVGSSHMTKVDCGQERECTIVYFFCYIIHTEKINCEYIFVNE